jgi:hypothetical protein
MDEAPSWPPGRGFVASADAEVSESERAARCFDDHCGTTIHQTNVRSMLRPIRSLIALALVLAACDTPTETTAPVPGEPSEQRQLWEQQGIDDYRFVFGRTCFCMPLPLVRVDVRDGEVVAVREADTGRTLPREEWIGVPTVEDVFDSIAQAEANGEPAEAEFHPTLGYPMRVMLGTLANDAGVNYYLDRLESVD